MKSFFPAEIFDDIKKKDGYIAFIFFIIYFLCSFPYIQHFKSFMIQAEMPIELKRLAIGTGFYIIPVIIICIILRVRKQALTTIGIRRKGFIQSIGIGIALSTIVFIIHIVNGRAIDTIITDLLFYVLLLGFSEEIIFRGFIWPRLVVLFGRTSGTILSGALFGIMHAPMRIIMNGNPITTAILSEIGGGIVGSLIFIFIYTRNKNIILPAMIHGVLDFMQ